MSFNAFLLSKLTNAPLKGADVHSLVHRYQALWIIYTNVLLVFALLVWKLCDCIYFPESPSSPISLVFPIIGLSMLTLKTVNVHIAAGLALIAFHVMNYNAEPHCSIASSHFQVLLQGLGFLLTSSPKVHLLNFICCLFQNIRHMYYMEQKFRVTFTEDQRYEIFHVNIASYFTLIAIAILFNIQNTSKNSLWEMAHSNFVKTEEIAKEMVQVAKAKEIFVSSLSHEIRNPLNCMNGSIDYLLQVVKNPNHLQLLNNAKMSGEVLLNLLSNVLDAAKLKAEKMELFYAEANIAETIKKVLILFCEKIREKGIKATVFIDRTLPRILWTDSSRILQIIINLLSNSLKFSPEGGKVELYISWHQNKQTQDDLFAQIQPYSNQKSLNRLVQSSRGSTLSLTSIQDAVEEFTAQTKACHLNNFRFFTEQEGFSTSITLRDGQVNKQFVSYNIEEYILCNTVQNIFSDLPVTTQSKTARKGFLKIQVSDNGCGICEDSIPKLFEMFSQAENTGGTSHKGTGLGLWICKQLCNKMGGDIKIYSQLDRGTSFVFYIPIDNDSLSMNSHARLRRNQDTLRALVVDDYPYNRDMHKLILERENIQVAVAFDGKQAVDMFTSHEEDYFQFIMMDVNMPVMDGFTAAKKIREWEAERNRKRVDIYFVSGEYYDEEDVMKELRKEGPMIDPKGIRCLKKPIDVGTIKKLVEKFQQ